MHNVPLYVYKNVTIVAILNLQNVANQTIRCQAFAKVVTSFFLTSAFFASKLQIEVIEQGAVRVQFFLYCMDGERVWNYFN